MTGALAGLRFEVMGPVRAWSNETELDVGSPQQRAVLAILLLSQGWQVSRDVLVDALWGEDPPRSAAGTVRTYISRLRRCLEPVTGCQAAELLKSVGDGYAIDAGAVTVDYEQFTEQVEQARLTRSRGDLTLAATQFAEALGLWRGAPLAGIQGPYAGAQRARLQELWTAVTEDRLSVDIESGGHLAAIAALRALLDDYPLREKLSELLMLALYRAGRQADALTVFHDVRCLLRDELGIDPGPGLRDLHARILRADDALIATAADAPVAPQAACLIEPPALLPTLPAGLIGRADTLREIVAAVTGNPAAESMPVIAITGMPGIGTTAMAIQAAHAARPAFPGGQLYADVTDGADAGPVAALARELPGRRVLAVLDGVRDPAQARALLDAFRGCAVIITTPRRMINFPGIRWFEVDPLTPDESMELLEHLLGADRVAADRAGAEWVLSLCTGQPNAIRIAAARLVARPAWKLGAMARQLEEELSHPVITHDDCLLVEAPYERVYDQLPDDAARVFRLASMSDGDEVSVAAVAARAGLPEHATWALLESVADAHLIQAGVFGSYRFDPLIKVYGQRQFLALDTQPHLEPTRRSKSSSRTDPGST